MRCSVIAKAPQPRGEGFWSFGMAVLGRGIGCGAGEEELTDSLLDPSCSGSGIVNRLDYLVENGMSFRQLRAPPDWRVPVRVADTASYS